MQVRTQAELDAALKAGKEIECIGDAEFYISDSAQVTAYDSAQVTAYDSAQVTASDSAQVTASDSAQVTASDSAQVTASGSAQVTASGSAQVTAYDSAQVRASDSAQVRASDSAQVTAYDSAQVTASDSAQVRAYGSAQVTAYGSAQVRAYGSAQVTAYDSAQVTAYDSAQVRASDSAQVTAYGSAQVTAYGSAQVRAYGSAQVTAYDSAQVTASKFCAITIPMDSHVGCKGGVLIRVRPVRTLREWCDYWNAKVTGTGKTATVRLYKATLAGHKSPHGMTYVPGTTVTAPDWDGGTAECGYGLHACSDPILSAGYVSATVQHYVVLSVRLTDCRKPQVSDSYPNKLKFRTCKVVTECDAWGKIITPRDTPESKD
jgi:hypothetical protein